MSESKGLPEYTLTPDELHKLMRMKQIMIQPKWTADDLIELRGLTDGPERIVWLTGVFYTVDADDVNNAMGFEEVTQD